MLKNLVVALTALSKAKSDERTTVGSDDWTWTGPGNRPAQFDNFENR